MVKGQGRKECKEQNKTSYCRMEVRRSDRQEARTLART